MKNLILYILVFILVSCGTGSNKRHENSNARSLKTGLERIYDKNEKENDLIKVSEQIPDARLDLLKKYIEKLEANNQRINNKSYLDLLIEADNEEYEREQKLAGPMTQSQYLLEKEQYEKERYPTKELCAHKWQICECFFQLELLNPSRNEVERAKNFLKTVAKLASNINPIITVKKYSRSTLVKVSIDPKIGDNPRSHCVRYYEDGTYEDKTREKGVVCTWTFERENRIKKIKSGGCFSGGNEEVYFLDIKSLNDTIFSFVEEREHPADDRYDFRPSRTPVFPASRTSIPRRLPYYRTLVVMK